MLTKKDRKEKKESNIPLLDYNFINISNSTCKMSLIKRKAVKAEITFQIIPFSLSVIIFFMDYLRLKEGKG